VTGEAKLAATTFHVGQPDGRCLQQSYQLGTTAKTF